MGMPPKDQVFAQFMTMRQLDRDVIADVRLDKAIDDRSIDISLFLGSDADKAGLAWFSIENGSIGFLQLSVAFDRWLNRVDVSA